VLLSSEIPSDQTLLLRMSEYASRFPGDIPKKYRDSYAYLVGRYFYSIGEYEQALELLKYIKPSSKFYLPSRYISGVTHVGNYDAKEAVAAFKDVLRPLTRKLEENDLNIEDRALLEQSWLGMARVFYSTGEYNKALKYYGLIPRKSPAWPKALFESSWAYFQLDLANKALGNLHTLNSPFFANFYSPEAPILAGVIFFYNCKYSRVKYELEEFEYSYMPVGEAIEELLAKYEDPSELYTWLNALQEEADDRDEQLTRILAASVDDKEIQRKIELVQDIEKELEKIKEIPATWRNSSLGTALVQDSSVAREFAVSELGDLVQARLERIKRELVDLNVNRERILFEVERAERGDLEADLRAEMSVDANETKSNKVKVNDEQLYWTFDGEYWKDELGFYQFTVNSSCTR
jgi:tetratricopeptide (TPR) repeat protein